jgi:aspartyl-tRNA(Asn)/glutamyl-tRNA(Gln) amidotransferase subunit A
VNLHEQSAIALRDLVASGGASAVEITQAALARIVKIEPSLHALLHVATETALAQAASIDRARAAGETLGPLAGVPVVLKDNLCVRGTPTTCASKMLEGWISPYDATAIARLRAAGAVLIAKANMDEFAMGSSNENSAYGPVKNPWDLTRVPGGSSGGSAASVAAGYAPLSLGSDTGGSVRQPGSFCGVVAFKPTYGRISRHGLIAFASSLDQIGPFARTTRDAARITQVMAGKDDRDATSADLAVPDLETALTGELKGLRVGVLRKELSQGCEPGVVASVEASLKALQELGATLVDVELPTAEHAISAYYILAPAECSSNLARFDGMRFGPRGHGDTLDATYADTRTRFGPEVQRRIMLGTYVLSAGYYDAFYSRAQKARTLLRRDFDAAFTQCDVVVGPTSPTVAFELGAKSTNPLEMYLADVFTLPASLAGLPSVSVPSLPSNGLPVGLQITGRAFDEATTLRVADALERATNVSAARPKLS